jgi:hypothetical protein
LASRILAPRQSHHEVKDELIVPVHGSLVHVKPATFTVVIGVPVGDGCVNDTGEDRQGYRAVFRDQVGFGLTPELAAEAAYLRALARPRHA